MSQQVSLMKNKSVWILLILISIIFIGINYVNANLDNIYVAKAEKCFKQNDIAKAQEYYEKAFSLGYDNPKHREIYVNSIINSPLSDMGSICFIPP